MTTPPGHLEPPSGAERLLRSSLARAEREAVLGDLHEEFIAIAQRSGRRAARRWYWRQAIRSVVPNAVRRLRNDERRVRLFKSGLAFVALGLLNMLTMRPFRHTGLESRLLPGAMWIVSGVTPIVRALFVRRLRIRKAQKRAVLLVGGMMIAAPPLYFSLVTEVDEHAVFAVLCVSVALFFVLCLWPWWPKDPAPPPPDEYAVRRKAASDDDRRKWLPVAVPNIPLGMSGLVLSAASRERNPSPPVRLGALTLRRKFTHADTVRVYAALNGVEAAAHAAMDVIDGTGHIVRTIPVDVTTAGLERVIKRSDDEDEEDEMPEPGVAEHFGEVDVRLRMADLAPGPYRVRLTVRDGDQSSVQQDGFIVTPG